MGYGKVLPKGKVQAEDMAWGSMRPRLQHQHGKMRTNECEKRPKPILACMGLFEHSMASKNELPQVSRGQPAGVCAQKGGSWVRPSVPFSVSRILSVRKWVLIKFK